MFREIWGLDFSHMDFTVLIGGGVLLRPYSMLDRKSKQAGLQALISTRLSTQTISDEVCSQLLLTAVSPLGLIHNVHIGIHTVAKFCLVLVSGNGTVDLPRHID